MPSPSRIAPLARARAARLPPAARRTQLLACALRVFARKGLGRGGHAEIAREANVSVAAVFTYFPTREALVREVLAEISGLYLSLADRHLSAGAASAPKALLDFAVAFAACFDSHEDHTRILLEWSTAVREDVWPLFLEFHEAMLGKMREAIERGVAEGAIERGVEPENAALMLIGAAHLVLQMKFTGIPSERIFRFQLALLRGALGEQALRAALA
jgi:TetR/AcrR family transcriptional regulator, hemagglutinin/protease regulatory protein